MKNLKNIFKDPAIYLLLPFLIIIGVMLFELGAVKIIENKVSNLKDRVDSIEILGGTNKIPTPIALFETTLASSISKTATSMTLTSATDKDGTTLASSTYAFIIDEGTASEEFVIADCTSTTCTNMTRGVSVLTGNTIVTALRKTHRRGSSVKITDGPQLLILTRLINGDDTLPNILSYESAPTFTVDSNQLATIKYIDDMAIAGSPDATLTTKGIIEMASQVGMASTSPAGSGDTTAWLGLSATYSTSTPDGTSQSGLFVPVSKNNGKLDQLWWDLTEVFTFSGNNIFSGDNTFSGTNIFVTSTMASTSVTTLNVTDITVSGTKTGIPSSADIQIFTSDGTWTKPTGAKFIEVHLFSGGGGGGSGARGDAGAHYGGTGGGAGGYSYGIFNASALGSTEAVIVGDGGAGGASVTTVAVGNDGTAGGYSKFGTTAIIRVGGGAKGLGGNAGSEAGGSGSVGNGIVYQTGGNGGAGGDPGTAGINTAVDISPRGGGGGGNTTTADGGNGGAFTTNYVASGGTGGTIGTPDGSNGVNGSATFIRGGTGGAGGYGRDSGGNSGIGGDGGDIGAGGGGGGANGNLTGNSGAGGTGGTGVVIVITHF